MDLQIIMLENPAIVLNMGKLCMTVYSKKVLFPENNVYRRIGTGLTASSFFIVEIDLFDKAKIEQ